MERRVYVPLPEEAVRLLVALAEREYRRPADQAAVLLLRALGLPTPPPHEEARPAGTERAR